MAGQRSNKNESIPKCAICGSPEALADDYPHAVCRQCDRRATNGSGDKAEVALNGIMAEGGDNPVYINGIKCWRRYRFGGWITMRDAYGCSSEVEFMEKMFEEQDRMRRKMQ